MIVCASGVEGCRFITANAMKRHLDARDWNHVSRAWADNLAFDAKVPSEIGSGIGRDLSALLRLLR